MQSQGAHGRRVRSLVIIACCIGVGFALTACGRKSALDPPPTAAAPSAPPAASEAAQPSDWRAPAQEEAAAPPRRNRSFVLDPLLN